MRVMSEFRMEDVAARLRRAKEAASPPVSLTQLAKEAGVGKRTIQDLLGQASDGGRGRGKRGPTLDTLERLARRLGVSAGWLAFGDGVAPPG